MAKEIERKFLVRDDSWKQKAVGVLYRQGYLNRGEQGPTVRVRMAGGRGFLTIKGPVTGISCIEYEYAIPPADAATILDTLAATPLIEKYRYTFNDRGHRWEVDEFLGENAGLVVAEVELTSEDEFVELPAWVGREVTGDVRYYNASLVTNPFSRWK